MGRWDYWHNDADKKSKRWQRAIKIWAIGGGFVIAVWLAFVTGYQLGWQDALLWITDTSRSVFAL